MEKSKSRVIDYVMNVPAYVFADSNLQETLQKMAAMNLKKITVIDKDTNICAMICVSSLFRFIKSRKDRYKLDTMKVSDIIDNRDASIVLYPSSSINDTLSVMNSTKTTCLPVAINPWDKRLIGFVEKRDLELLMANCA